MNGKEFKGATLEIHYAYNNNNFKQIERSRPESNKRRDHSEDERDSHRVRESRDRYEVSSYPSQNYPRANYDYEYDRRYDRPIEPLQARGGISYEDSRSYVPPKPASQYPPYPGVYPTNSGSGMYIKSELFLRLKNTQISTFLGANLFQAPAPTASTNRSLDLSNLVRN